MNKSILIATPGRCGSHWLMDILTELLELKAIETKMFDPCDFENNISTAHNLSAIKATMEDPFCTKFEHISGRLESFKLNVIILVRDPRDICVSIAHYTEKRHNGNFDNDFKRYLKEGSHNAVFFNAYKSEHETLRHYLIKFEKAILHPHDVISGMLNYFGYKYDSEKLDFYINKYNFNYLQKKDAIHYRKGVVGDWKNYMTEEQNKEYCEKHADLMELLGYDSAFIY